MGGSTGFCRFASVLVLIRSIDFWKWRFLAKAQARASRFSLAVDG